MGNGTQISVAGGRMRQALRLVRALLRHHHRTFFVAVGGAAVFAACTVYSAVVVRMITDEVIDPRFRRGTVSSSKVVVVLGALILLGCVRAAGVVVRRTFAGRTQWRAAESISAEVIDRLSEQAVPWHRSQSTGDLVTGAGVDAEAATAVLSPLPFASGVVVLVGLSSVLLVATDLWLGLAAVAVFPLLIVISVKYQLRVEAHYDTAQDELGRLSAAVHESFDGVAVVKSFGAERRETERLAVIASRLREARLGAVRLRSTFEALLDALPTVVNILLLVGGAYRVRAGAMTVGELTSCIYLFTLLVFPLRLIGYTLSEVPHSLAGWNRIRALLDQPVAPNPADTLLQGVDRNIGVAELHFAHDGEREVLAGVDAVIEGGRTTAVVGATGSGKTTLLHLIAGLIPAGRGTITVPTGGIRLVFQEPFLFASTIRENITMGEDFTEHAIDAALAVAEAGFVHDLPDGLDTEVGERGVSLSGGQRQRLALARALVRRPAVLLLDDTTSALDPNTEAKVLANLRATLGNTTVVVVASRPSTISLADDVLFLDGGVVVAHGRHDELMQNVPRYRRLIEAFEHDRAALDADADADATSGGGV
ncbi:MAG: ATP-binding cassette domain-containing protein [Actinobacteria bacterium]|nr:ATP-binding cassette domain-containing protein [Actinomycetota bacterium]MSW76502.1 ATP-binding cassette domain-containing protein [Actinomycetota bacterium]MSZ82390.1 ATP-binding cassette domain-containing protein [Actinomycetota bacterium]MTB16431.1 ATP-binding cassette domain-containing protein [Actinomycetota bacterium]